MTANPQETAKNSLGKHLMSRPLKNVSVTHDPVTPALKESFQ
jgi:hypothetical protein